MTDTHLGPGSLAAREVIPDEQRLALLHNTKFSEESGLVDYFHSFCDMQLEDLRLLVPFVSEATADHVVEDPELRDYYWHAYDGFTLARSSYGLFAFRKLGDLGLEMTKVDFQFGIQIGSEVPLAQETILGGKGVRLGRAVTARELVHTLDSDSLALARELEQQQAATGFEIKTQA